MLWRNMAAMATEEMLRANPIDGVVLLGGCDKTIPSLLMAAASVDLPAVVVPGGPMLTGTFRGVRRSAAAPTSGGSARRSAPARCREEEFLRSESSMIRSRGHCNTMGTASTMAMVAEALGHDDPRHGRHPAPGQPAARGARTRPAGWRSRWSRPTAGPATSSPRARSSTRSSPWPRSAARPTPSSTCSRSPAGSASTLTLDDFDRIGADVPLLVDLQPAGRFLMEDLHRAGGLLAVLREVRDLLDPTAITVTGRPLVDHLDDAEIWDREVIRPRAEPAPAARPGSPCCAATSRRTGAVIKPAAASPHLLQHRGRAVVFDSIEDLHARIDDPDLDVDADSVLVLRGCGPQGLPGHAGGRQHAAARRSCSSRASATWSGSATAG